MEVYKYLFREYPDIVSVGQMYEMLNISTKTGYRLLKNNAINHFKIGKTYKIPKLHIFEYIKVISKLSRQSTVRYVVKCIAMII
jgi:excisionase family DNA binding protein